MVTKFISDADKKFEEWFMALNWVSVNHLEDPEEHKAWTNYRREALGCQNWAKNYTVPSAFPPTGQLAAQDYANCLREIRRHNHWTDARATRFLKDVQPWR